MKIDREAYSSPDTQVNYSDPKTPRVVAVCQFNEDNKGEVRAYCDYGQTDQPAVSTEPITLTTRQAATLIAQGSGITRQPPGPKVVISMAFIVYTNPAVRYQTTTILGTAIEVEFTPTSYTWNWGDGTTTTTTDPTPPWTAKPPPAVFTTSQGSTTNPTPSTRSHHQARSASAVSRLATFRGLTWPMTIAPGRVYAGQRRHRLRHVGQWTP